MDSSYKSTSRGVKQQKATKLSREIVKQELQDSNDPQLVVSSQEQKINQSTACCVCLEFFLHPVLASSTLTVHTIRMMMTRQTGPKWQMKEEKRQ